MTAPLSAFAKAMRRSHTSSKSSTRTAERMAFSQSPLLRPLTLAERSGKREARK